MIGHARGSYTMDLLKRTDFGSASVASYDAIIQDEIYVLSIWED